MIKLFRALKSENIKLWTKLSAKLFLLIAVILSFVLATCVRALDGYDDLPPIFSSGHAARAVQTYEVSDDWISDGEQSITQWVARMNELSEDIKNQSGYAKYKSEKEYDILLRNASVMRYRIDKNIVPADSSGWDKAVFTFWLTSMLMAPLYLVLISDVFAGEYTRNTIRTIFPRPITRIKQYIAKHVSSLLYAAAVLAAVMVGSLASCAVVGGGFGDTRYIGWLSGGVLDCSRMMLMFMLFVCVLVSYIIAAALCAAVGNLTRSRGASAAVGSGVFVISWLLGEAICAGGSKIAAVSVFAVLDLTVPLMQTGNCATVGFNTCVVCAAAYYAVFAFLGYSFFKKDV